MTYSGTPEYKMTGIVFGGQYTIAAGVDKTKIDLTVETKVQWVDYTVPGTPSRTELVIPPTSDISFANGDIPANTTHWIAIKNNAGVAEFHGFATFEEVDRRNFALIGTAWTDGTLDIVGVNSFPFLNANGVTFDSIDYFISAPSGVSFLIDGGLVSTNGANLLLDIAEGKYWRLYGYTSLTPEIPHFGTDAAITGEVEYFTYTRTGPFSIETDLDVDNYDEGGTKTAIPSGRFVAHRIYHFPKGNFTGVQYGSETYTSLVNAIVNYQNEEHELNVDLQYAVWTATVIAEEGTTDLTDASKAVIRQEGPNASAIANIRNTRSYTISDQGTNDTFYAAGYYDASSTDTTLTIGGTVTQVHGNSNQAYGAHAFCVASGAGGTDLVLTVSGTSITDDGVRTTSDSEIIVADTDQAVTDQYFETAKKWLGPVTYTLTGAAGSFTFNYGLAKYEDFGDNNFTVTDFEIVGLANANASGLNVELLSHTSSGWVYAATGFDPGNDDIITLSDDYSTDTDITNNEYFAWKRAGLSTFVEGAVSEGVVVRVTQSTNNSVRYATVQIGVLF